MTLIRGSTLVIRDIFLEDLFNPVFPTDRGFYLPLVQFERFIACEDFLAKLRHKKGEALNMATAKQIVEMLGLKPHPTCGFVTETYRSNHQIPRQALPGTYEGSRPFGSVLYFMVTPEVQIRLHRIRSDQMYHHYLGDPLEVLLLYPGGDGEVSVVGSDFAAGMRPQLFIPGGTFHISRLRKGSSFALLGTTEWPGVEPPDVETGDRDKLITDYPGFRDEINEFTR